MSQIPSEFILRVICLIRGKEVRRKDILDFEATDFLSDWYLACESLERALARITDTKTGYGAFDFRRLVPFSTQIVPLAALLAYLAKHRLESGSNFKKLDEWYWATVFQNRYNEAVNTQSYDDYRRMIDWFSDDGKIPSAISGFDLNFRDLRVEAKSAATYRGVLCLVALAGALDFQTGQAPNLSDETEDDHIFPKSLFSENEIYNRTLIATNKHKGNQRPAKYFSAVETLLGASQLRAILQTHLIDEGGLTALLGDDLPGFRTARERVIRDKVKSLVPSSHS